MSNRQVRTNYQVGTPFEVFRSDFRSIDEARAYVRALHSTRFLSDDDREAIIILPVAVNR